MLNNIIQPDIIQPDIIQPDIIQPDIPFKNIFRIKYSVDDCRSILRSLKSIIIAKINITGLGGLNAVQRDFCIKIFHHEFCSDSLFDEIIEFMDKHNQCEQGHFRHNTLSSLDNDLDCISEPITLDMDFDFDSELENRIDKINEIKSIKNEKNLYKKYNKIITFNKKYKTNDFNIFDQMIRQFYYFCLAAFNQLSFESQNSIMINKKQTIIELNLPRKDKAGNIVYFNGLSHQPLEEIKKIYKSVNIPYNDAKIYIHSFGNPIKPGGGYTKGATSQEEELCRLFGSLFSSLCDTRDNCGNCIVVNDDHEATYKCDNFYVGNNSGSVILTETALTTTIERNYDKTLSYNSLADPIKCGIVTSFASDNRFYTPKKNPSSDVTSFASDDRFYTPTKNQKLSYVQLFVNFIYSIIVYISSFFVSIPDTSNNARRFETDADYQEAFMNTFCAPALFKNASCIIIGSWGCGVFKNEVDYMLNEIMKPVIEKYRYLYDVIIFAAPNDRDNTTFFDEMVR
jgi:hypothetical protein